MLIVLLIDSALPGIGLDENITKSSGNNDTCLWVPLAIRDNAASGSPWLPVHNIHNSFLFKFCASFASTNIDLSWIRPLFNASSIDAYILLPNTINLRFPYHHGLD